MDYHLRGEIRLRETTDYSLYPWCLREFNEDGKQVGRDQIPCDGTLFFTATDLTVRYSTGVNYFDIFGNEKESEAKESEGIYGYVKSGMLKDGSLEHDIPYRLFRTDRKIGQIFFRVIKLKDDSDHDICGLRGYPSFTSEPELGGDIEEDNLTLAIGLVPLSYDKLIEEIRSKRVDDITVELSHVPGFYSEWTPAAFNNAIKVLLHDDKPEAHQVVVPDNCAIDPPRLGEVKEFELSIKQNIAFDLKHGELDTDESIHEEDSDPQPDVAEQMMTQLNRIELILDKIQTPIKLIVAILALILLALLWK